MTAATSAPGPAPLSIGDVPTFTERIAPHPEKTFQNALDEVTESKPPLRKRPPNRQSGAKDQDADNTCHDGAPVNLTAAPQPWINLPVELLNSDQPELPAAATQVKPANDGPQDELLTALEGTLAFAARLVSQGDDTGVPIPQAAAADAERPSSPEPAVPAETSSPAPADLAPVPAPMHLQSEAEAGPPPPKAQADLTRPEVPVRKNSPIASGEESNLPASPGLAASKSIVPPAAPRTEETHGHRDDAMPFNQFHETPDVAVTDRTRSVEPVQPKTAVQEIEVSPPEPARNLSLRITGAEHEKVDIRLMDRGGEIRVAVRTPDVELARNLRGGISELTGRLEQSGYHTEIWRPAEAAFSQPDHRGHGAGEKEGAFGARDGNAQRRSQESQQQSQEREEREQPRWVEEMATQLGRESFFQR